MSTITNDQMIIREETIQNGFENIVDGVDIDYEIRITQRKNKLELEIGDIIVGRHSIAQIKKTDGHFFSLIWENDILATNREKLYHKDLLRQKIRIGEWKIYKEVSIEDLNI